MTNTQNPAPDWGDASEWQQPGSGQPFPGGYQQASSSAPPQYGPGYQQPAPPYPQAPWQGATAPPIQTYLVPAILVTLFCFLPTGSQRSSTRTRFRRSVTLATTSARLGLRSRDVCGQSSAWPSA